MPEALASDVRLALCTVPDAATAERLAEALLGEGLAACVTIVPGLTSVYRWQGAIQRDSELLLLIKLRAEVYPRLEARLRELHPYELPEVLSFQPDQGLPAYLAWVLANSPLPDIE